MAQTGYGAAEKPECHSFSSSNNHLSRPAQLSTSSGNNRGATALAYDQDRNGSPPELNNRALSTPPHSTMDGHSRAQQEPLPTSMPTAPPVHPGPPALHEYYHHLPPPPNYAPGSIDLSTGTPGIGRYPIPPSQGSDPRAIGGRQKKEIKRRTKTGCLTCRKRRIKCDETHPVCRNCQKSKRECEGYDPIFKQQPPPANIQPAPSAPPLSSNPPRPLPPPPTGYLPSQQHHHYSHVPQGYSLVHPPYAYTLPPPVQSSYAPPAEPPYTVASHLDHPYANRGSAAMASPQDQSRAGTYRMSPDGRNDMTPDGKREAEARSDSRDRKASNPPSPAESDTKEPSNRGSLKMEHLYMIGGVEPPTPKFSKPITPEMTEEIKFFYVSEYARGVDQILETTWYSSKGVDALMQDKKVCGMFADMLELFGTTKSQDYDIMRQLPSTESRMVWALMCLPRGPQEAPGKSETKDDGPSGGKDLAVDGATPATDAAAEHDEAMKITSPAPPSIDFSDPLSEQAKHRLSIFEHLILGRRLVSNPLNTSEPAPGSTLDVAERQLHFWRQLGNFVSLTGSVPSQTNDQSAHHQQLESPATSPHAFECLASMRTLLDRLESRDVLYSIALIRVLSPKFNDFPDGFTSQPYDPNGDGERMALVVAKKFIEDEAAGKGTGQVIQRLCGMAVRAWIHGWGLK